ncbi:MULTISPECIES: LytTR family DNA-binding domain-containing protein [unclassified Lysinibacillus]|uniref:LytTR family DNA-binding domain-containing protein n=1 Tax=unclassified Lysinibacillus TaxID=2636778 RepID=UPI0025540251|nr:MULTISPECIES: LytTR family DNA-binding domain-containing protein [unclassified Lysinibacillus]MDM5249079.1 LytTR family DNA-binding domain-containing protein [Lysinibacillus sp. G4S2]
MKVELSIDPTCKEPKVIIHTDKMTDEIEYLMQSIVSSDLNTLSVFSDRGVEFINCGDIVRIYTEQKKVFVQTVVGIYTVRLRLYELEEKLNTQMFVRISNAEIVNRNMIKHMDISRTGTIGVELKGGIKTYASRRYVAKIKKQLGI